MIPERKLKGPKHSLPCAERTDVPQAGGWTVNLHTVEGRLAMKGRPLLKRRHQLAETAKNLQTPEDVAGNNPRNVQQGRKGAGGLEPFLEDEGTKSKTRRLKTPECVFVVTLPTADTEVFNKQLFHLTAQATQPNVCRVTDRRSLISSVSWLMMYTLP